MAIKQPRQKPLPLPVQDMHMKRQWPSFACEQKTPSSRVWIGTIQPTDMSSSYTVKISYRSSDGRPHVTVLDPELKRRTDAEGKERAIPHVYKGPELCLFLPWGNEWTCEMSIASTIVPWASLWLYFYEVWHATGEWLGEGEHPPRRDDYKPDGQEKFADREGRS